MSRAIVEQIERVEPAAELDEDAAGRGRTVACARAAGSRDREHARCACRRTHAKTMRRSGCAASASATRRCDSLARAVGRRPDASAGWSRRPRHTAARASRRRETAAADRRAALRFRASVRSRCDRRTSSRYVASTARRIPGGRPARPAISSTVPRVSRSDQLAVPTGEAASRCMRTAGSALTMPPRRRSGRSAACPRVAAPADHQVAQQAVEDHREEIVDERRVPAEKQPGSQVAVMRGQLVDAPIFERRRRRRQRALEPLVEGVDPAD